MFESTLLKSIALSCVTGSITEALKLLLLYININSIIFALLGIICQAVTFRERRLF